MSITRKQFLGTVIGVAGTAVLYACGGDDGGVTPDAAGASCTTNGTSVNIASNHGHVLVVSKEDVVAGAEKVYDIMGTATHTHSVTVTAAHFTMLQGNMTVSTTSTSGGGHTHGITIMCA